MRILEILLLAALLPAVLGFFLPAHRRPHWLAWIPFAALIFALLHLGIEGYRWQMAPAYALVLVLCLIHAGVARRGPPLASAPRPWWRETPRVLGALLLTAGLAAATGLPLALPMFDVPQPSGEHAIGTVTLHMVDASRQETFTDDPHDKRELMVQAWYPARTPDAGAEPEPFWGNDPHRREMLATSLRQPGFLFDHLAMIPSHSYPDAPLTNDGAYPVLIFSHGYAQGFSGQNTVLMEELASHGYAVFSIGHPYESSSVIYPDGRAVTMDPKIVERLRGQRGDIMQKMLASTDKAERKALAREMVASAPALTSSVHLWVADTKFVLDQLTLLNGEDSSSPFKGRLDLSRVGVLGMSFGGTTAGQATLDDPRIAAGVNLDGTQYGDLLDRSLQKPFMFMHSAAAGLMNEAMYENSAAPAWYLNVKDTQHFDFTDFPLVAPGFKLLGALGKIPAERAVHITNAYTLAFFEQHLKGQESTLLKGNSSDYPEVEVQTRSGNAP